MALDALVSFSTANWLLKDEAVVLEAIHVNVGLMLVLFQKSDDHRRSVVDDH